MPESLDQKAVRLLNEQLAELDTVRGLNCEMPQFKAWHQSTESLLRRFLSPTSPHLQGFIDISFWSQIYPAPPGHDRRLFVNGCGTAQALVKAVIREIENFGVHTEQQAAKPAGRGGVNQTIHAHTVNQAIANDDSTQHIGHIGDATAIGFGLEEIRGLLEKSTILSPEQVRESLVAIDALTLQIQKTEHQRNWKSVLHNGEVVLTIADKATDLGRKLMPYLPAIYLLMERGKH